MKLKLGMKHQAMELYKVCINHDPWMTLTSLGGTKVRINGPGHMTKMAAMAINSKKTLKIFFSRTRRPMKLKLGIKHQAMKPYKVCVNHDPGMTLTFFTARST